MSEDAAYKRIQAARAARRFPSIFEDMAEGRLHLAAVCLLAPHLTAGNAAEFLAASAGRTKAEVERLVAERFPRTESLGLVEAIPAGQLAAAGVNDVDTVQLAPGQVEASTARSLGQVDVVPPEIGSAPPRPTVVPMAKPKPHAPGRYSLHLTMSEATYEKLHHVQGLMSHTLPSGDPAEVIDRALDALARELERRKYAAASKPRMQSRESARPRHIPACVKRAVWARDEGRCTFVSESGRRCDSRQFLEFDHVDPVARGGRATVDGLRLRCRGHNQLEAARVFGADFMEWKRAGRRR